MVADQTLKSETSASLEKLKETEERRKKVQQEYDKLKAGEINEKEWATYLILLLENYVKSLIAKHHYTAKAPFDDLMNRAREAIWVQSRRYDPHRNMPTVFFKKYIIEALRKTVEAESDNKAMTNHYRSNEYKLNRVAQANGYDGLADPRLSIAELSIYSGVSASTIAELKDRLENNVVSSLDKITDNFDAGRHYGEPEKELIEKERDALLLAQWERLTDLEKFLLNHTVLAIKYDKKYTENDEWIDLDYVECSSKKLVSILRSEWGQETFKGELPANVKKIDINFVEQTINHSIRKIQQNPKIREFIPVKAPTFSLDNYEQADVNDLEEAFVKDELFGSTAYGWS